MSDFNKRKKGANATSISDETSFMQVRQNLSLNV